MKVSRKILLFFLLIPLLSLALGAWYYWHSLQTKQGPQQDIEQDRKILAQLDELVSRINYHQAYLQNELLVLQSSKLFPDDKEKWSFPNATFKASSLPSVREAEAIFKNDKDKLNKNPEMEKLRGALETLKQYQNSFRGHQKFIEIDLAKDAYLSSQVKAESAIKYINKLKELKHEQLDKRLKDQTSGNNQHLFIVFTLIGIVLLLSVLGIIITQATVAKPLKQILSRLQARQKLPDTGGELGVLASHINKVQTELDVTENALGQIAKGQIELVLKEDALEQRQQATLADVKAYLRRLNNELVGRENEVKSLKDRTLKLEEGLEQTREHHKQQLQSLQAGTILLEYDPSGKVLNVNYAFVEATGYTAGEVTTQGGTNDFDPTDGNLAAMWSTVSTGANWRGTLRLRSRKNPNGLIVAATAARLKGSGPDGKDRVVFMGIDITKLDEERQTFEAKLKQANADLTQQRQILEHTNSQLQNSLGELEAHRNQLTQAQEELLQRQQALAEAEEAITRKNQELQSASEAVDSAVNEAETNRALMDQLQQELEHARQELDGAKYQVQAAEQSLQQFNQEHEDIKTHFERQKALEYRLVQQQSAMQELTRNRDLKEGNVREAVRSVTEGAAFALNIDRVGLWLFIDNGTRLRCLDLFSKNERSHNQGPDLLERDVQLFFQTLKKEVMLAPEDPRAHPATLNLLPLYLEPFGVKGLMAAAVRLGGMHVGMIMVENTEEARLWAPDEQNFLVAVSDVVSLALEQGNRRAMEEELRMTLEESQALEEELRQNAEEIEATNEEMRRTQVELRGQIAALNNAAIVVETNLEGRVTYANQAFIDSYKYDQKEVLGKNLNIIGSGHHSEEFWQKLWGNITQGLVYRGEICNKAKDGSLIWNDQTITPVLGIDGTPYKYISVAFDITGRKVQEDQIHSALNIAVQQEELLRRSSTEMASANDEMRRTQIELAGQINALNNSSLVFETDMEGNIIYANDALLRASGYQKEDLIGQRFNLLRSGRQSEALYQDQWKSILNGKIWRGELENLRKDGDYFWAVTTSTPVLNEMGEPLKTIHVLFDITEQKQQEFRLKKQQTALSKLSAHPAVKEGNADAAFQEITKVARETLNVNRASIWFYNDKRDALVCRTVAQESGHVHDIGAQLAIELYPTYIHTLERDRLLAAYDAVGDPRTRELAPGLFEPGNIRSVMDAVITVGVEIVGILSLEVHHNTRHWTLDEQSFASSIAEMVGLVLEQKERMLTDRLKEAYAQLEMRNEDIAKQKTELEETTAWLKESIRYAKRIQQNILPSKAFMDEHLDNYFVVYRPKDVVGGDFYWFNPIGNQSVMVVADGTGHGVPGAFLTLIGYLLLNQIVLEKRVVQPSEILRLLHLGVRSALKQEEEESTSRDGFDMAVCTFNRGTYEVEYAGANLPFYYYQDWEIHEIKPTKKSIGGEQLEEERVFQNHSIQLRPGDAIYMYTDGFVDQIGGPDEKRFTSRRFRDLILRTQHESLGTQRALLNLEWKDWKEEREQLDDVTVFGMKFN